MASAPRSPQRCRRASLAIISDESLQDMAEIAGFGGIAAAAAIFTHSARSENHRCLKVPRFRRMLMISRITRDVLESYLFCRYKGYLKWIGHQGIKSDYEVLLA